MIMSSELDRYSVLNPKQCVHEQLRQTMRTSAGYRIRKKFPLTLPSLYIVYKSYINSTMWSP